ncbi:MAG: hypothetical protein E6G11_06460 [Actinobacteria bacterium]|nr:MAG: hypothetical protein E6G11_06460 [Actinomycetota bacterium]
MSRVEGWEVLHRVHWWAWLVLALPEVVLLVDFLFGGSLVRTRRVALALLGVLVVGNLVGLSILVAGLVSTNTSQLSGGELLLTGSAIWITNVIVFGLWYWEIDDGGPVARARHSRTQPDFQFSQDENPGLAREGWGPQVWDYLYVSLTNSIAFSPTDAMPLTRHAKASMALGSVISVVAVLLVAARAVNVLGA